MPKIKFLHHCYLALRSRSKARVKVIDGEYVAKRGDVEPTLKNVILITISFFLSFFFFFF